MSRNDFIKNLAIDLSSMDDPQKIEKTLNIFCRNIELENKEVHLLGYGPLAYNLETRKSEFRFTLEVSREILDWLRNHDMKLSPEGSHIYIVNQLEYHYVGLKPKKS